MPDDDLLEETPDTPGETPDEEPEEDTPDPTLVAVKLALGITVDAYDAELTDLIEAALLDLGIAGVEGYTEGDKLVLQAVKTYVRAHFQSPADYDRLKASYDEQKGQLMIATGYTDWGDVNGSG